VGRLPLTLDVQWREGWGRVATIRRRHPTPGSTEHPSEKRNGLESSTGQVTVTLPKPPGAKGTVIPVKAE